MSGVWMWARRMRLGLQLWVHQRTAWPALALMLVAAVCALWLLLLHPLRQQVSDIRFQVVVESGRRADMSAAPVVAQATTANTIEPQLSRLLGEDAGAVQLLEQLFTLARQHDLQLRRGEYKPAQWRSIHLDTVQVTLPLQGNYATLRGWILDVLSQVPQASIDRISMRRDDVKSDLLEADVILTLWRKMPAVDGQALSADKTAAASAEKGRR